jgi:16S rRNA (cytosine1402-N4)-methyltransferase
MNLTNLSNIHTPVLLEESIRFLNINANGTYVDCTAGRGGHAQNILAKLGSNGRLICLDNDQVAIDFLTTYFNHDARVKLIKTNFTNLGNVLKELKINGVDGVLADLGVSSPMFDDASRGFSYHLDSKLDMRMDQTQKLNAHFVVNKYDAKQLTSIFKQYGEIANPRNVVNAILKYRKKNSIDTTLQLVDVIKGAVGKPTLFKKKHPARNYFQAIRIEVNNELDNLIKLLNTIPSTLNHGARVVIISFHSLEDRIVKQAFQK